MLSKDLNEADIESIKVAETQKAKVFTFTLADVPIGAKIEFVKDSQITATVVEPKKVILDESPNDGSYFLSPLTLKILEERFGVKYISVQGSQYWVYEAETLQARRERIEERLNASEQ